MLLVEDHTWFRQALALYLARERDIEVVADVGTFAECFEHDLQDVDLAIVDLSLPDGEGADLIRGLQQKAPWISILVLTASIDSERHLLAQEAGAREVLFKSASLEEIREAVHRLGRCRAGAGR
ncbi:MAG: response regulator transcription factor [Actinomycetota bacterium]